MANLESLEQSATVKKIYDWYVARSKKEKIRYHIGGSDIGDECERKIWYAYRWALPQDHEGRMLRLFDTGHREELRVINDLRNAGCEVYDKDPGTGEQYTFADPDGVVRVNLDGVVTGLSEAPKTPHFLECKTMNTKNFKKLKNDGCKAAMPKHYAQCQMGMLFAELERAFYIVVCKETDEIYAERIKLDKPFAESLHAKARKIAESKRAPVKLSEDPAFWLCKFCDFHAVCHGEKTAKASCRTCLSATAPFKGSAGLECTKCADDTLPNHLYDPQFVGSAKKIGVGGSGDAKDGVYDYVIYESEHGRFANETAGTFPPPSVPSFVSRDLELMTPIERNEKVAMALRVLGGKVIDGMAEITKGMSNE